MAAPLLALALCASACAGGYTGSEASRSDPVGALPGKIGVSSRPTNPMLCGSTTVIGRPMGDIPGASPGCGIKNAVLVEHVAGVALSRPALMHCSTARALETWITDTARPTLRLRAARLVELQVAAHYTCRSVNNQPGARVSEHGKGRAIDISALTLRSGRRITVLDGWKGGDSARILRRLHKGACGPFSTVLGPESDSYHQDHFHFDTAAGRRRPYCR